MGRQVWFDHADQGGLMTRNEARENEMGKIVSREDHILNIMESY